jgi:hypothetical protein
LNKNDGRALRAKATLVAAGIGILLAILFALEKLIK